MFVSLTEFKGKEEFHAKGLQIEVSQVSAEAKRIIESQGGTVLTVYFSRVGLRNFLKAPDEEDVPIRFARAPPKLATRYDMPRYIPAHKRHVLDTSWSPQTQHMNFFSSEPLPGELDPHTYTLLAEQTLNEIEDEVEELLEDSALEDYDIHNQDGVLTINLGSRGTYVINKQTPNKEIWWSSPIRYANPICFPCCTGCYELFPSCFNLVLRHVLCFWRVVLKVYPLF